MYAEDGIQHDLLAARDPKAGDVVIFNPAAGALEEKQHFWQQDPVFVKRVVAVEGDEVEVGQPFSWHTAAGTVANSLCQSALHSDPAAA